MYTKPHILLIYTGGTIGMMKNPETGALSNFNFNKLLEHIPELNLLDCTIDTISFAKPIDSSDFNLEKWYQIADIIKENYTKFNGFVVLHGSDTMSYSASALSFILENLSKPVIFTGSQLPIGDLRTDAKENLITAIQIAALQNQNNRSVIQEVGLYFEYKLYRGNRTTKISTEKFNAFASPNFPQLAESGVHLQINEEVLLSPDTSKKLKVNSKLNDNIVILKLFPGIKKEIVNAILNIKGLKGIILETYGSGNASSQPWFINELAQALEKNIKIVNVTQCSSGFVSMGKYETSLALKEISLLSGHNITTEAAVTKLMYLLGQNVPEKMFKKIFETPLRGEMD